MREREREGVSSEREGGREGKKKRGGLGRKWECGCTHVHLHIMPYCV